MQRIYDSYTTAERHYRIGGRHQPAKPAFPAQLKLQPRGMTFTNLFPRSRADQTSHHSFYKKCPVSFITTSNTQLRSQNLILTK